MVGAGVRGLRIRSVSGVGMVIGSKAEGGLEGSGRSGWAIIRLGAEVFEWTIKSSLLDPKWVAGMVIRSLFSPKWVAGAGLFGPMVSLESAKEHIQPASTDIPWA